MVNSTLCVIRTILLILACYEQIALENLALRQQFGVFQRTVRRRKIRPTDRLFWICLRKIWKGMQIRLGDCPTPDGARLATEMFQTLLAPIIPAQESGPSRIQVDIRKLVVLL